MDAVPGLSSMQGLDKGGQRQEAVLAGLSCYALWFKEFKEPAGFPVVMMSTADAGRPCVPFVV